MSSSLIGYPIRSALFHIKEKSFVNYYSHSRILYRLTNNEGLVNIQKYNLYFYSFTATFVWNTNTVRESSHISFFCGGRRTHTGELTGLLEWLADLPLRLRDQHISVIYPKLQTLYCLFKSHTEIWTSSSPHVFSVYGWLSELTYFSFFPVICWSYLQTEISVILSTGNKLHSFYHPLFFSFLWNHFIGCWIKVNY